MDENIFISWSKPRSRELALAANKFLPRVIQAAKPWVSKGGIESGQRWNQEIAQRLDDIQIGIVCLTPENLEERWLNFESGALAKRLTDSARLCPYLLDLEPKDIGQPLSQFQASRANKDETYELIKSLNSVLEKKLDDGILKDTFEKFWPDLEEDIQRIRAMPIDSVPRPRDVDEILDEMVERLQAIESQVGGIRERPALLKWQDVRPYLEALATKADTEISRNNAKVETLKKITLDPKRPESEKTTSHQNLHHTEIALEELTRLQVAVVELIRAKEETGRYFNL